MSVLFKDLRLNVTGDGEYSKALINDIESLDSYDEPIYAAVKLHLFPTRFMELPEPEINQYGYSVVYKIMAWGDSEAEQFENHHAAIQKLVSYFKSLQLPVDNSSPIS